MPTYEYLCPAGHEFEKFQKMSDSPRVKCPECGRMAVRQISGGAGLMFKGSGFYITDYGKDGKGPRKAESGSEGSDSKPAEKSEKPVKSEKSDKPAAPAKAEKAAPEVASKSARKKPGK
ncbi:MAG: FmdB family zinc ribbon protein [Gemmatimonadales bacterium]